MNKTAELASFLAGITTAQIGEDNLLDIRYKLLDWIGCCIAARTTHSACGARSILLAQGGNRMSTAIGLAEKTSSHEAAFYNGIISHALEYDDTNKIAITHPGAPVIAAALAAAEASGANLGTLACGIAAGYEAMIRLGAAINPEHYEYWHTTGTCGTFAAAAAAGRIFGLDAAGMERALGIASTMASGLICVFGTEAKLVTVGNAARNGLIAAELALQGYTAPEGAFDGPKGFARAARGSQDLDIMVPKPGDRLMLEDAYYKMHASCGHTHSALDALQALMQEHEVRADAVERVDVKVYHTAYELCAAYMTSPETKAKFSLPYCVANMLLSGRVTLTEFDPQHLGSEAIRAYAERIHIEEEPAFTANYPVLRTERVTLTMKDGAVYEKQVDLPVGRPPYAFIEDKFHSLAGMTADREKSDEVFRILMQLPLDAPLDSLSASLRTL